MIYAPIFKDTYYTSSASYLVYHITFGGSTIFSGKAYAMPGGNIKININKVCADYLSQNIDLILEGSSSQSNSNAIGTFTLTNDNGSVLETYVFLYCWDDTFNWQGGSANLSMPISDTYGSGMTVLTTTCTSSSVSTSATSPLKTDGCINYGLYYVNRRGGWDTFAIRGAVKKSEKITQFNTDRAYNNTTKEFENNRYLAEIKTTYELNTHYLTDDQAANLVRNLLSSNKVYLHNLIDGTIKPVVITDNSVNYQTYATNKRKMAQYKINIEESQSRLRR